MNLISLVFVGLSITSTFSDHICSPQLFECSYDIHSDSSSIRKCKDDGSILTLYFNGNKECNNWSELLPSLIQQSQPNHPCCLEDNDSESEDDQQGLIVGGTVVLASKYPFIVDISIGYKDNSAGGCGGSLLRKESPAIILTAAHCFDKNEAGSPFDINSVNSYVILHGDKLNDENGIKLSSLSQFKIHPNYISAGEPDIGLLFINQDLTQYTQLSTVQISSLSSGTECCNNGDDLTVIGYGADFEGGPSTATLEEVDVDFMNRAECQIKNNEEAAKRNEQPPTITNNMICAYRLNVDSCQGDSGGPLIKKDTNKQVGIVSFGIGCAAAPGIYTNIGLNSIYNWIIQEIASGTGSTPAPTSPSLTPTKIPTSTKMPTKIPTKIPTSSGSTTNVPTTATTSGSSTTNFN